MTDALKRWLLILRIPLALAGVVLFFTLYNRFLLDKNLQNLRTSFSVMDGVTGVGQAEAALLLVDQTLEAQMASEELDLRAAAVLQYSQGVLSSEQSDRLVDDSQVLVAILAEEQADKRPAFLKSLDAAVSSVQRGLRKAALLPRQALELPPSPEIDMARMQEAAQHEFRGRPAQALTIFQELLASYPNYQGRAGLKLRTGALLQKTGNVEQAERYYREALADAGDGNEAAAARQMLARLHQIRSAVKAAAALETAIASVSSGPERQKAAFKAGSARIQSYEYNRASELFWEAYAADPEGALAFPALFKQAWCLSSAGRKEEALQNFMKLIEKAPGTDFAVSSLFQLADIYKAAGNPWAAADLYERATKDRAQDAGLIALAYAQAGCIYEFDLHETGKSQVFLREVAKRFPASAYSSVGRRLEDLRKKKGRTPSARGPGVASPTGPTAAAPDGQNMFSIGSPLINWLENFLPVFVNVFTERLSKYMAAVGEKKLARRFTEVEFGELVVREVQRRFPGQLSDVKTKIHPDGFVGSGNVHLGILKFTVEVRLSIVVKNYRPNAVVQGIKVGAFSLPEPLLKFLEERVNANIDSTRYPLKVREYALNEGYAWISVEVAE